MKLDHWKRLAAMARQAPAAPPAEMPFGFDTRVIANWRAQADDGDSSLWVPLLRGALVCSVLIVALTVAVNYQTLKEREPTSLAIADSAIQLTMLP
jgi:anti-sigma-K factor RskA